MKHPLGQRPIGQRPANLWFGMILFQDNAFLKFSKVDMERIFGK
jgi:hypothetical protein